MVFLIKAGDAAVFETAAFFDFTAAKAVEPGIDRRTAKTVLRTHLATAGCDRLREDSFILACISPPVVSCFL